MDKNTNLVPLVNKERVPMEHLSKWKIWGAFGGAGVGMWKYFLQITASISFAEKLFQAVIIAGLCALAGGFCTNAGKWLWDFIKKTFIKSK